MCYLKNMKALVVTPTYNEIENIEPFIKSVLRVNPDVDMLIVDDSSPDGTGQKVSELMKSLSQLHLLTRAKKEGLGRAYIAGFQWALERKYDVIVEMDADFSHRPEDLKNHLEKIKSYDFVVGSRWVPGGGTVNWGLGRQMISKGGSFYSRLILGYPVRDWTGGFNLWKKEVLEKIVLDDIQSEGYSFQIELKYRALKKGFKMLENPIIFEDRRVGQSKMSSRIVFEALLRVWSIRWTVL